VISQMFHESKFARSHAPDWEEYCSVSKRALQTNDCTFNRGGSRNFGKGDPVRGRSPKPSAEGASAGGGSGGLPEKILKTYMRFPAIWHIFLGSEWPRISFKIGPLLNKKQ